MLKKTLKIILILYFLTQFAVSQEITIENINVQRGITYRIPVKIDYSSDIKDFELKIKYNALLLEIKSIKGGPEFVIQDDDIYFYKDQTDFENSEIGMLSNNIAGSKGNLCEIEFEALAGPDSIAFFIPYELNINNDIIDAQFNSGKITIGNPVYPIAKNSISLIYPNPVNYQGSLDIQVQTESEFALRIYSLDGTSAMQFPSKSVIADEMYILDLSNNQKLNFSPGDKLPKGSYRFVFTPRKWFWSSQNYYLAVKIGADEFLTRFIIIK